MIYLWEMPERPNKDTAVYDQARSPDRFLFRYGTTLCLTELERCYAYYRSSLIDLNDDFFIRTVVRHNSQSAYIFTQEEMFSFAAGLATKIKISLDKIKEIKAALSLTEEYIDKGPKILSNEDMAFIDAIVGKPLLTRTRIFYLHVTKEAIQKKYDSIPNNTLLPLVNQKIIDLLLELAPEEVQFFDAEIHCKDGVLRNYKLLNITHKIVGIDHEKTIHAAYGFKYLTYKPGCMKQYKLARDEEYLGNILVTEEIKQAFERAKIKGIWFVRPEDYYADLLGKV